MSDEARGIGPATTLERVGDLLLVKLEDEERVVELTYSIDKALEVAQAIITLAGAPAYAAIDVALEQILDP